MLGEEGADAQDEADRRTVEMHEREHALERRELEQSWRERDSDQRDRMAMNGTVLPRIARRRRMSASGVRTSARARLSSENVRDSNTDDRDGVPLRHCSVDDLVALIRA